MAINGQATCVINQFCPGNDFEAEIALIASIRSIQEA